MQTYAKFQPTSMDHAGLGLPDQQDWLVAPCATNRDACFRTEANWRAQLQILAKLDEDGADYEVHRFGHWGNGWFEIVIVRPDTACAAEMLKCEYALLDYPILDENLCSELEFEAAQAYWKNLNLRERVGVLSEQGLNIMAARRGDELPSSVSWENWDLS